MSDKMKNLLLKVGNNKILVDAIINRHPITFYYSGPVKLKKTKVKRGYRVKAEPVAMGPNKKSGRLMLRAYIDEPSVSKRGTPKKVGLRKSNYGWRTFMISRMSRIEIFRDETFNTIREKYKPGDDKSFSETYVSTDFSVTPPKPKIGSTKKEPTPIKEPKKPKGSVTPLTKNIDTEKTVTKQSRELDKEFNNYDDELQSIENEIKTTLDSYKNSTTPEEQNTYVTKLKELNLKKNDLINKVTDAISTIGSDIEIKDLSKVNNFKNKFANKKKDLNIIVPDVKIKPPKLPDSNPDNEEESKKDELPQIKPKNKPDEDVNNLNEHFINRVKRLIIYR